MHTKVLTFINSFIPERVFSGESIEAHDDTWTTQKLAVISACVGTSVIQRMIKLLCTHMFVRSYEQRTRDPAVYIDDNCRRPISPSSPPLRCGLAIPQAALDLYGLEMIIEPYRETTLTVKGLDSSIRSKR